MLPRMGTPKPKRMARSTIVISASPTTRYGASLPSMRPRGSIGVTGSCASVPFARSPCDDVVAARGRVARDVRDAERARRAEPVHQLAGVARPVLVDDDRRQVRDGLVDEPEEDELEERNGERDDERGRVARDVDELLADDRHERRPEAAVHVGTSRPLAAPAPVAARPSSSRAAAASSVSVTKTSSSEGSIARTDDPARPARARRSTSSSSETPFDTTAWTAVPKIVAPAT